MMTFQEFCVFLDSSITIIDPFLLIQLVSKSAYLFSVSFPPNISVKGTTAANSHLTFGRLEFEMLNNVVPVKHSSNCCLNIDVSIQSNPLSLLLHKNASSFVSKQYILQFDRRSGYLFFVHNNGMTS